MIWQLDVSFRINLKFKWKTNEKSMRELFGACGLSIISNVGRKWNINAHIVIYRYHNIIVKKILSTLSVSKSILSAGHLISFGIFSSGLEQICRAHMIFSCELISLSSFSLFQSAQIKIKSINIRYIKCWANTIYNMAYVNQFSFDGIYLSDLKHFQRVWECLLIFFVFIFFFKNKENMN